MPNVLLLINEEAHIRELARVAELPLTTSNLRPVVFMEERMKHLGVPKVFADLGIEVLTPDNVSPNRDGGHVVVRPHPKTSIERLRRVATIWPQYHI